MTEDERLKIPIKDRYSTVSEIFAYELVIQYCNDYAEFELSEAIDKSIAAHGNNVRPYRNYIFGAFYSSGFIELIRKEGVGMNEKYYCKLIARGYKFKQCQTFANLLTTELADQKYIDEKKELDLKILKSQIVTNENTQKTNFSIKAILIATAFIYTLQLLVAAGWIPYRYAGEKLRIQQQDSIIRMQEIRFYQKESQEYRYLSERDSLRKILDSEIHKP